MTMNAGVYLVLDKLVLSKIMGAGETTGAAGLGHGFALKIPATRAQSH